jgi:hypothetical protein
MRNEECGILRHLRAECVGHGTLSPGDQSKMSGYSGTPLARKLGIKPGSKVVLINGPTDYLDLLSPLPENIEFEDDTGGEVDLIHIFTNSRDELFGELPKLTRLIKPNGSIWVSWYKKAAKLPTEITEDTVREAAFPIGLVDVKVCAVDERWSGLKLVIRKENRI